MATLINASQSNRNVQNTMFTTTLVGTCSHGITSHEGAVIQTSTPLPSCHDNTMSTQQHLAPELNLSALDMSSNSAVTMDTDSVSIATMSSDVEREELEPGHIAVPILGYEVMEERARFSVFKIQVSRGPDDVWFIFRRYSDFDHLNKQLKEIFPHFRLALPPKKWFGDNFDKNFLEDRMIGLQAFLNNLVGNREVCNSQPVREFFCFDEPPGPHDSLEESRALCENLEERVFSLHQQVAERDRRIMLLEDELRLSQLQVENLRKALKTECALYTRILSPRQQLHADHVVNLVLLDIMEKAAARRNSGSGLASMKEVEETEELQDKEAEDEQSSEAKATQSRDNSLCLTDSLKAAETIRLTPVNEVQEMEFPSPDTETPVITQASENTVVDRNTSRQNSTTVSHSMASHQHAAEIPASTASHQGAVCNQTDIAGRVRYDAGDMTGPGQLCLSSSKLASASGRVGTLSSPQAKLETLLPPDGQEMTSPGAHSVDSSSKKRTKMSNTCDIQSANSDACNNNEAVLI